jgi:TRAP-type C4-dicarboxylate transport system substrate-binding protein
MRAVIALAFVALLAPHAGAEPIVLRAATVAPDGSSWANALKAFSREIEQATGGAVRVKWYTNAVAGDEQEMTDRLRRGQLDGVASGGVACQSLMPSTRVLSMPALFQTHEEARFVMNALDATLAEEARRNGFELIGQVSLGVEVLFAKAPVHSFAELRRLPTWRWSSDDIGRQMSERMGLTIAVSRLDEASRLFEQGRVDGFWAIPTTALVFQWSLLAPYLHPLHNNFRVGCLLASAPMLARMTPQDRQAVLAAAAHLRDRFDEVTRKTDNELLNGGFQHQGVKIVPLSESFRAEYFAAANAARDGKGAELVPAELLGRVRRWLGDYRAAQSHPPQ